MTEHSNGLDICMGFYNLLFSHNVVSVKKGKLVGLFLYQVIMKTRQQIC